MTVFLIMQILEVLQLQYAQKQQETLSNLTYKRLSKTQLKQQLCYCTSLNLIPIEVQLYFSTHMGDVFSCESNEKKQFRANMQKKITSQRNEIRKMDKLLNRQKNSFHEKEITYRQKITKLQHHIKKKQVETAALKEIRQKLLLILSRKIIEHRKQIQSFSEIDEQNELTMEAYHQKMDHFQRQILKKEIEIDKLAKKFKELQLYDLNLEKLKENSQRLISQLRAEVEHMQVEEQQLMNEKEQEIIRISRKFSSAIQEKQIIMGQLNSQNCLKKTQSSQIRTSLSFFQNQSMQNLQQTNKKSQFYYERLLENTPKLRKISEQLCIVSRQKLNEVRESKKLTLNHIKTKLNNFVQELQRFKTPVKTIKKQQNNKLFDSEILLKDNDYKQFLVGSIEDRMRKKIVKTKLIYKYDGINETNVHKYIDNIPQLLLLAKLENGYYIAAYSQGPFTPQIDTKSDGLILSLTKHQIYPLLSKNSKAISYDQFNVIFGNNQLYLKPHQHSLVSNFTNGNNNYFTNNQSITTLLGTTAREVPVSHYEFYQIFFKEQ